MIEAKSTQGKTGRSLKIEKPIMVSRGTPPPSPPSEPAPAKAAPASVKRSELLPDDIVRVLRDPNAHPIDKQAAASRIRRIPMTEQERDPLDDIPESVRGYYERYPEQWQRDAKYYPGSVAQTRQATRDAVRAAQMERETDAALRELGDFKAEHPSIMDPSDPTFQKIAKEYDRLLRQGHSASYITEAKAARNILAKRGA